MVSHTFSTRPVILRIRSCVLVAVVTLGLVWIGLLSLDAYLRGGYRTPQESASVVTLLAVNAITSISIPIFVLLDYSESTEGNRWFTHVRFELAFMSTHLVLQTTAALLFTILSQSFRCDDSDGNADHEGECRLLDVYISIASWLTPLLLLSFMAYFSLVSFRTSRRFPALWRTAVRFCPWDDRPMSSEPKMSSRQISQISEPRDLEDGGRKAISSVSSSKPSSRQSVQSVTPLVNSQNSSQRTPQSFPPRAAPGVASSRVVSQLPPSRAISQLPPSLVPSQTPAYRPMSQPPSPRPPLNRVRLNTGPSRVPAHVPSTRVLSRPLPLRPAATPNLPRSSVQTSNVYGLPSGRVHTSGASGLKGPSNLDRYAEEWNRDRRDLTMHPTWLARR